MNSIAATIVKGTRYLTDTTISLDLDDQIASLVAQITKIILSEIDSRNSKVCLSLFILTKIT